MGARTGARGARGATGATGATGAPGEPGVPGATGPTGPAAAILQFGLLNVAAGDNATPADSTPVVAPWCGVAGLGVGWVAPRAGSVTALSAALSEVAAGSDAIVGVYKNGTLLPAAIVTVADAAAAAHGTFVGGTHTFIAGDVLDVRVRTGSAWSATTADLGASVEVTF